jgi:hypothetical protein
VFTLTLALFLSFSASVSSFCSLRLSGILKVPSSFSAALGTTNLRGPVSVCKQKHDEAAVRLQHNRVYGYA